VFRARRDTRKVFRTLIALRGLFCSLTGGCLLAQHPFLGILIAQERFLMAEAKTHTPSPERFPLFALGYSLLLAVLAAGGLYALFISGPAMRMAAQEQRERAIADEDRQSCAMFGMRSDSAAFAACSRELAIIRQKQVERDNAAAQGIL
jgi:hypothetical protein